MFRKYDATQLPWYREFDPHSVMLLYFSAAWTGGQELGKGDELSESDKAFIAKLYPKR